MISLNMQKLEANYTIGISTGGVAEVFEANPLSGARKADHKLSFNYNTHFMLIK
jgi:hypothetical protein